MDLESAIQFLQQQEWLSVLILFAGAAVEYLFPPFPGDTVTLAGAVLVTGYGWSLPLVFAATTLGSLVGAMADFYVGVWWYRRRERRGVPPTIDTGESRAKARAQIDRLVRGFQRHGPVFLVINRFLPGVRAFFFVAAGLAGMRPAAVAFYAGLSAALWNGLLIAAGMAIGANLQALEQLFRTWSTVVWGVLGAIVLYFVVRWAVRRLRRGRKAGRTESGAAAAGRDTTRSGEE